MSMAFDDNDELAAFIRMIGKINKLQQRGKFPLDF